MCSWEASDRPRMCRVLIISFNLLVSNTEQMLRETQTWGRSHSNQWQNQDWVPGPCDPSGCAHSQICYILPGCLWPIRCDFLNTRSFHTVFPSLWWKQFFELLPGLLLKSTRTILEPVMLLAHPHHHDIFIFLRNRLVRCRLICWVLKPGVMEAGWDGDLSQEHKVPGPVLVWELLYTILLNSYLCLLLNER